MTKISVISGIGNNNTVPVKIETKKIPLFEPLDFLNYTDGELTLKLLDRELEILSITDDRNKAIYQNGRNMLNTVKRNGIHNVGVAFTGVIDPILFPYLGQIRTARKNGYGSLGNTTFSRIGEIEANPEPPGGGVPSGGGIDMSDWVICGPNGIKCPEASAQHVEWLQLQQYATEMGEMLDNEKGGYYYLYDFEGRASNNVPQLVAGKRLFQNSFVDNLSSFSGVSRSNVSQMARNGILSSGPQIQPEAAIQNLEINGVDNIGDPVTITLAVLAAVSFAIKGIAKWRCKKKGGTWNGSGCTIPPFEPDLLSLPQHIANADLSAFKPEDLDWYVDDNGNWNYDPSYDSGLNDPGGESKSIIPLAIAGGLGYIVLNQ